MPERPTRRPGRLPGVSYIGIQRYLLTLCTPERRRWFEDAAIVEEVRSRLAQSATDHRFAIPAHCLMPDHVHLLAEGTTLESNLEQFVSAFKQATGHRFSRERGARLWQVGYHDRMLRNDEATLTVVRYILQNPVRAGLVARFSDYPYSGSDRYSLEQLADAVSQAVSQG